jgi:two-component system alkaline phosphatase synthesis response regulator PhoP
MIGSESTVRETAGGVEPAEEARVDEPRVASTVLIIEDHVDFHESLALRLRASGVRVISAHDGFGGLCVILEEAPDLVVLDLVLPDLHGLELMRFLRTMPGSKQLPVVVLTGDGGPTVEERALALGARRVLYKPIRQRAIVRTILDMLRGG